MGDLGGCPHLCLGAQAHFVHFIYFEARPRPWILCLGWSLPRLTLPRLQWDPCYKFLRAPLHTWTICAGAFNPLKPGASHCMIS